MTTEEYHILEQIALKEPWWAARNLKTYLSTIKPEPDNIEWPAADEEANQAGV